ncbi:mechanosensitive ion channel family protein [Massilia sp. CFBP9012]|uniref:mechanosensitive ion channel family protein n=1 Tax=Massilia sp. CFBP9012 TaxID=3096531 RepID=UPI002A6B052A|nr:mechanosensitive ion channel family protein [Massilia sp. CFBP9012]MDY0973999.1 mechanosensitive ion channel family protein [Massilia sp. CFBP9012]
MRAHFSFLFLLLIALAGPLSPTAFAAGQAEEAAPAEEVIPDPLKRETPRSMVSGLISALAEPDYDRAAQYLDTPAGTNRQRTNAISQARNFHALLDNGGSLSPFVALSNEAIGKIDDDLPAEQENVGVLTIQDKKVPVLLTRSQDGDHQVWRVSRETIDQVAQAARQEPVVQEPDKNEFSFAGAPLKDWAMLVGLGVLIFGGLWTVAALIVAAMRRLVPDADANGLVRFMEAALPPASLLIAVGLFYSWAERLPVSIVARTTLLRYTGIVSVIALVWFGLRLIDAVAELATARMQRSQRRQVVAVITLARRAAKILLLVFSGIAILGTFGIDVTTGIAALGIGGIALALGAQKTVENLVGSVTVIADKPLQVGDFVKVGDVVGTVEDVGIRSTRIRTGERTVVTIPNGDLSARQIENFAARDRFLFNPTIAVEPATSPAKLKEAISIVQQVLTEEKNMAEGHRARLGSISDRAFNVDIWSYINVSEFDTQVIIRETLLLTIYERLDAAGISIAFPTQRIVFSPEQLAEAREQLVGSGNEAAAEAEPGLVVLDKSTPQPRA